MRAIGVIQNRSSLAQPSRRRQHLEVGDPAHERHERRIRPVHQHHALRLLLWVRREQCRVGPARLHVEQDRRRPADHVAAVDEHRHQRLARQPLHVRAHRRIDVHVLVRDALQVQHVADLDAVVGEGDPEQPHQNPSL